MNTGFELHDSTVAAVVREPDVVRIVFEPAYIHRSAGRPGIDGGEGWVQPGELVFSQPELEELGTCAGAVSDGTISSSAGVFENILPLPFTVSGGVQARIAFTSGGVLTVRAAGVTFVSKGLGQFVEKYVG